MQPTTSSFYSLAPHHNSDPPKSFTFFASLKASLTHDSTLEALPKPSANLSAYLTELP